MPDTATVGHNRPPLQEFFAEQNQLLPEQLRADFESLLATVNALLEAEARCPKQLADSDEEMAGKVIAYAAQVTGCIKAVEAKRVDLTAGPLTAQRIIMEFCRSEIFTKLGETTADKKTGSFGGLRQRLGDILTSYERRKADAERKRREEDERRAREAAEAAARAQQEAARLAREAEEAERRRQEEAAKAVDTEQDLAAAIAAEEQARADQAARDEAARIAAAEADRLAAQAAHAAEAAEQKTSSLSRTAGAYGTSSSLRENWKARIADHGKVDLAAIRDFIKPEAIEDAANRFAKLHKNTKPVAGVEFYDASRAVVRG